eukprot:6503199-Alexandrium_andersonii.AAC.1
MERLRQQAATAKAAVVGTSPPGLPAPSRLAPEGPASPPPDVALASAGAAEDTAGAVRGSSQGDWLRSGWNRYSHWHNCKHLAGGKGDHQQASNAPQAAYMPLPGG